MTRQGCFIESGIGKQGAGDRLRPSSSLAITSFAEDDLNFDSEVEATKPNILVTNRSSGSSSGCEDGDCDDSGAVNAHYVNAMASIWLSAA